MAVYPDALVTSTEIPDAGANLSTNPHSDLHDDMRDEIVAIEAELGVAPSGSFSTVRARLDAGWQPIATADFSAASTVDIAIPSSTYKMVKITILAGIASGGPVFLNARVNNDSTAGLHAHVLGQMFGDATQTNVNGADTAWNIGAVNTNVRGAFVELTIGAADISSNLPFLSKYGCIAATEADIRQGISSGRLTANRTISSLRIFPSTSTMTGTYIAEGWVAPS